ncbi:MAG: FAD-binding oxidoreductase [Methanobacteriota archaeon]
MEARALKWWGWGFEDVHADVASRPALWAYVRERLALEPTTVRPVVPRESVTVPPSLIEPSDVGELERAVGEGNVSTDDTDRILHAVGRGYKDLVRLRAGRIERAPDAVVYPEDEGAVRAVLELARRRRVAVVPFGGGTSVVGGVETPSGEGFAAVLALDLRRMRKLHEIDATSRTATFDAGVRGPVLEESLNAQGFTFPHVPQSWEFSTLGGWIATRSVGALSNRYGAIEDLVVAVRLVSPTRTLDVRDFPRDAHGPGLREIVLGSEGSLGVITRATVRVHPMPRVRRFGSRLFRSFADGLEALRGMAQGDALPATTVLSDEEETRFVLADAGVAVDAPGRQAGVARVLRRFRGGRNGDAGSLLLMGFEGTPTEVARARRRARRLARGSASLGPGLARRSFGERLRLPYLRDSLLDRGVLVDTVETAAPWSRLHTLHDVGRTALREALWSDGGPGLVLCHTAHVYRDGASLYFTFLAKQRTGDEVGQWSRMKDRVTRAILDAGGALSHHHGVGADHTAHLGRVLGEDGLVVLRALKRELDPDGIMNPGKLVPGSG